MTQKLDRAIVEPRNPNLNASRNSNLPHSPAVRAGDYLFLSGMGPRDPATGERVLGPVAEQVRLTLTNMRHLLESGGSSMQRVVRIHFVVADPLYAAEVESIYRDFFPTDPPCRTMMTMQLRNGNACEIECIALTN